MAAKLITLGLTKIEIGDILTDGSMGTSLTQIGYTDRDSCVFASEDPQETEIEVEEVDDAIDIIIRGGKKTLKFTLADPDEAALALLMGGTAVTTTGSESYTAPDTFPILEKSIKVTPSKGLILSIPRARIVAKWNGAFSKSTNFKVDVVATVMTPTKSGLAPFSTTRVSTT
jgi:hypothetical protein